MALIAISKAPVLAGDWPVICSAGEKSKEIRIRIDRRTKLSPVFLSDTH